MGQREEVCKLANELAKQRGGQPYQYMGEAWEKIRQKQGLSNKRVPIKANKPNAAAVFDDDDDDDESSDDYDYQPRKIFGMNRNGMGGGLKNILRKSIKATADSCNFAKAPKDSPKDVFTGINLKHTDPIPKCPESIKRMFKIW